jgi:hypothetical protein
VGYGSPYGGYRTYGQVVKQDDDEQARLVKDREDAIKRKRAEAAAGRADRMQGAQNSVIERLNAGRAGNAANRFEGRTSTLTAGMGQQEERNLNAGQFLDMATARIAEIAEGTPGRDVLEKSINDVSVDVANSRINQNMAIAENVQLQESGRQHVNVVYDRVIQNLGFKPDDEDLLAAGFDRLIDAELSAQPRGVVHQLESQLKTNAIQIDEEKPFNQRKNRGKTFTKKAIEAVAGEVNQRFFEPTEFLAGRALENTVARPLIDVVGETVNDSFNTFSELAEAGAAVSRGDPGGAIKNIGAALGDTARTLTPDLEALELASRSAGTAGILPPEDRKPLGANEVKLAFDGVFRSGTERAQFEEALLTVGVAERIIGSIILDPLNLLPVVGFTKVDDFIKGFNAIKRGGNALAGSPQGQAIVRGAKALNAGETGAFRLGGQADEPIDPAVANLAFGDDLPSEDLAAVRSVNDSVDNSQRRLEELERQLDLSNDPEEMGRLSLEIDQIKNRRGQLAPRGPEDVQITDPQAGADDLAKIDNDLARNNRELADLERRGLGNKPHPFNLRKVLEQQNLDLQRKRAEILAPEEVRAAAARAPGGASTVPPGGPQRDIEEAIDTLENRIDDIIGPTRPRPGRQPDPRRPGLSKEDRAEVHRLNQERMDLRDEIVVSPGSNYDDATGEFVAHVPGQPDRTPRARAKMAFSSVDSADRRELIEQLDQLNAELRVAEDERGDLRSAVTELVNNPDAEVRRGQTAGMVKESLFLQEGQISDRITAIGDLERRLAEIDIVATHMTDETMQREINLIQTAARGRRGANLDALPEVGAIASEGSILSPAFRLKHIRGRIKKMTDDFVRENGRQPSPSTVSRWKRGISENEVISASRKRRGGTLPTQGLTLDGIRRGVRTLFSFSDKSPLEWYTNAKPVLEELYAEAQFRVAGLIAATSPQTLVESNVANALRINQIFKASGESIDLTMKILRTAVLNRKISKDTLKFVPVEQRAELTKLAKLWQDGVGKEILQPSQSPVMATMLKNIEESLSFTSIDQTFTGTQTKKISSFYRALMGDGEAIVLDTWMARALGIHKDLLNDNRFYELFSTVIREEAELAGVAARDYQAVIWDIAKTRVEAGEGFWRELIDLADDGADAIGRGVSTTTERFPKQAPSTAGGKKLSDLPGTAAIDAFIKDLDPKVGIGRFLDNLFGKVSDITVGNYTRVLRTIAQREAGRTIDLADDLIPVERAIRAHMEKTGKTVDDLLDDFAAQAVDKRSVPSGVSLAGESGRVDAGLSFLLARAMVGAGVGFGTGDDLEERIVNAFVGAGLGAAADPRIIRTLAKNLPTSKDDIVSGARRLFEGEQGSVRLGGEDFDPLVRDPGELTPPPQITDAPLRTTRSGQADLPGQALERGIAADEKAFAAGKTKERQAGVRQFQQASREGLARLGRGVKAAQGTLPPPKSRIRGPAALPSHLQDQVGAALERLGQLPDRPVDFTVDSAVDTVQGLREQVINISQARDQLTSRIRALRSMAKNGEISQATLNESIVQRAQVANELNKANKSLKNAYVEQSVEDILERVRMLGGSEELATILEHQFRMAARLLPADESLVSAENWRRIAAQIEADVTGTPSGLVGQTAKLRFTLVQGLSQHSADTYHPLFNKVSALVEDNLDDLKYVGPEDTAEIAEGAFKAFHVVQHPEWFTIDAVDGLKPALNEAQEIMRAKFVVLEEMGITVDEVLSGPYLEQLWEEGAGRPLGRGITGPRGRPSITKQRAYGDYVQGIQDGLTPRDLSLEELMIHSDGLTNAGIADAWMRRELIQRTGSSTKIVKGPRPFRTPSHGLYRGWFFPDDVANSIDDIYKPASDIPLLRGTQEVAQATKNTIFGPMDVGVGGIQIPLALSQSGFEIMLGGVNRALGLISSPWHMAIRLKDADAIGRSTQRALMNVNQGMGSTSVTVGEGTLLKYIPGLKKIDEGFLVPKDVPIVGGKRLGVTPMIDAMTEFQFGFVLREIRNLAFDGHMMMLKAAGEDITDPVVYRKAGEWADASTGASAGALTPARRSVESTGLVSFQMTRAAGAVLSQVAEPVLKAATGQAVSKMSVIRSAMVLANVGAWVYGLQWLFNSVLGDGPREWVPGKPDWGTIQIPGTNFTVPILPNKSHLRAIDKSIEALIDLDPKEALAAWTQFGYGKMNPLGQAPIGILTGVGFEPGSGRFGSDALSTSEGGVGIPGLGIDFPGGSAGFSAIPLPPTLQMLITEDSTRNIVGITASTFGFNPYENVGNQLRADFEDTYNVPFNNEVDFLVAAADPKLRELMDSFDTKSSLALDAVNRSRVAMEDPNLQDGDIRPFEPGPLEGLRQLAVKFMDADEDQRRAAGPAILEEWEKYQQALVGVYTLNYIDKKFDDPTTPEGIALKAYREIIPIDVQYRDPFDGQIDWLTYFNDKDEAFDQLEPRVQTALNTILRSQTPEVQAFEPVIEEAQKLRGELFDPFPNGGGKYKDPISGQLLTVEQSAFIDGFMREVGEEARRRTGDQSQYGTPEGVFGVNEQQIIAELARAQGREDLIYWANGLNNANFQRLALNPQYVTHLRTHRKELEPFYPQLYSIGMFKRFALQDLGILGR